MLIVGLASTILQMCSCYFVHHSRAIRSRLGVTLETHGATQLSLYGHVTDSSDFQMRVKACLGYLLAWRSYCTGTVRDKYHSKLREQKVGALWL